jgi:hypothetical protein
MAATDAPAPIGWGRKVRRVSRVAALPWTVTP